MSETFSEFVGRRKAEIQDQMKVLRAELNQLAEAEKLLDRPLGSFKSRPQRVAQAGKLTLKEMALSILEKHPAGLEALTIIESIKTEFGAEIPRSSMSPQLSRLGAEGVLERSGLVWRIVRPEDATLAAPTVQNDETPQDDPPPWGVPGPTSGSNRWEDVIATSPRPPWTKS